jgi:DNA-binding XRE family transcriptional regulator
MHFTQTHVASLLKHKGISRLSQLENGKCLPTLLTALKLAAIYRAPVEALFADIFLDERDQIRKIELRAANQVQRTKL